MTEYYSCLSNIEKIDLCIEFVAYGSPIPVELREFLRSEGLLRLIEEPIGR